MIAHLHVDILEIFELAEFWIPIGGFWLNACPTIQAPSMWTMPCFWIGSILSRIWQENFANRIEKNTTGVHCVRERRVAYVH